MSSDGQYLLSVSDDKTLKVWERNREGQCSCTQTLRGHSIGVNNFTTWSDGTQQSGPVHFPQTLEGHSDCVRGVLLGMTGNIF